MLAPDSPVTEDASVRCAERILIAQSEATDGLASTPPFDDPARTRFVHSGREALALGLSESYQGIVLEPNLAQLNGFKVCDELRRAGVETPVLFLAANGSVRDRIRALDLGADDFMLKPFSPSELAARIRAHARRAQLRGPSLRCGGISLDRVTHAVSRAGMPITLSMREYRLLEVLMLAPGHVFSREELLGRVWGPDPPGGNCVDVYVGYLRQKVDRPFGRATLRTIRGAGYVLRAEG